MEVFSAAGESGEASRRHRGVENSLQIPCAVSSSAFKTEIPQRNGDGRAHNSGSPSQVEIPKLPSQTDGGHNNAPDCSVHNGNAVVGLDPAMLQASTGEVDNCKLEGIPMAQGDLGIFSRRTPAIQRAPDGGMLSVRNFEGLHDQVRCKSLDSVADVDVLHGQVRCRAPDSADVLQRQVGRLAVENVGRTNSARPHVLHVSGKHPDVCINGVHVDSFDVPGSRAGALGVKRKIQELNEFALVRSGSSNVLLARGSFIAGRRCTKVSSVLRDLVAHWLVESWPVIVYVGKDRTFPGGFTGKLKGIGLPPHCLLFVFVGVPWEP